MKSILWAICLLVLLFAATDFKVQTQVNSYKDGTPGVSGYRSEVLAEVMIQEDKFLRVWQRCFRPINTLASSARCTVFCRSIPSCFGRQLQHL